MIDLHSTTDAQVWAREFQSVVKDNLDLATDEGFLIGWFANAIETGRTSQAARLSERIGEHVPVEIRMEDLSLENQEMLRRALREANDGKYRNMKLRSHQEEE